MDTGPDYAKRAKQNAKFFGGGSLVNPGEPQRLVNTAKKFAAGTAGFDTSKRKKRKKK
jgi:hypothetical protein